MAIERWERGPGVRASEGRERMGADSVPDTPLRKRLRKASEPTTRKHSFGHNRVIIGVPEFTVPQIIIDTTLQTTEHTATARSSIFP